MKKKLTENSLDPASLMERTLAARRADPTFDQAWDRFLRDPHSKHLRRLFEELLGKNIRLQGSQSYLGLAAGVTVWTMEHDEAWDPHILKIGGLTLQSGSRIPTLAKHDDPYPRWIAWRLDDNCVITYFAHGQWVRLLGKCQYVGLMAKGTEVLTARITGDGSAHIESNCFTPRCILTAHFHVSRFVNAFCGDRWIVASGEGEKNGEFELFIQTNADVGRYSFSGKLLLASSKKYGENTVLLAEVETPGIEKDIFSVVKGPTHLLQVPEGWSVSSWEDLDDTLWYARIFGLECGVLMRGEREMARFAKNKMPLDMIVAFGHVVVLMGYPVLNDNLEMLVYTSAGELCTLPYELMFRKGSTLKTWPYFVVEAERIVQVTIANGKVEFVTILLEPGQEILSFERIDNSVVAHVKLRDGVVALWAVPAGDESPVTRDKLGMLDLPSRVLSTAGEYTLMPKTLLVHGDKMFCVAKIGKKMVVMGQGNTQCALPYDKILGKLRVENGMLCWEAVDGKDVITVRWPMA